MIYSRGKEVVYQGRTYTVDYVMIDRDELKIYLTGLSNPAPADQVYCEPTELKINVRK